MARRKGVLNVPGDSPPDGFLTSQKAQGICQIVPMSLHRKLSVLIQPKLFKMPKIKVLDVDSYERPYYWDEPSFNEKMLVKLQPSVFGKFADFSGRLFVRPCPAQPRHGILESFPITVHSSKGYNDTHSYVYIPEEDFAKFSEVINNLRKEGGMVAIQPYISAEWSGVLSPDGLVVGRGTDGVTAGRRSSFVWPEKIYKTIPNLPEGGPYQLEFVFEKNPYCVQLRKADSAPLTIGLGTPGFLPENPVSLRGRKQIVIRGMEQLAELERLPAGAKVMVWHPDGNPLSHAAAWCVQQRFPYCCSEPKAKSGWLWEDAPGSLNWSKIKPTDIVAQKLLSPQDFSEEFFVALDHALRASGLLPESHNRTKLLRASHLFFSGSSVSSLMAEGAAYAVALTLRSAWVSILGELRYADASYFSPYGQHRHFFPESFDFTPFVKAYFSVLGEGRTDASRLEIVTYFENHNPVEHIDLIVAVARAFSAPMFGQSPGVGGPLWSYFSHLTADLARAITKRNFAQTNLVFQQLLHCAHNGGWALNKRMNQAIMGECCFALGHNEALRYAFEVCKMICDIREAEEAPPGGLPHLLSAETHSVLEADMTNALYSRERITGNISYSPKYEEAMRDIFSREGWKLPEKPDEPETMEFRGERYIVIKDLSIFKNIGLL